MDTNVKSILQTLIFAVLYLLLFVIVTPALIRMMDQPIGKTVFGVLVMGGVILALRLRQLSQRL